MRTDAKNILIGGEAGQGLVTIGQVLAKALVRMGYSIVVTQSYQSRIRGGHNTFAVRVSEKPLTAPEESVDLLVALDQETVEIHRKELGTESLIIADRDLDLPDHNCLKVPFQELAPKRAQNVAALGVLGSLLGIGQPALEESLDRFFGKKDQDVKKQNQEALAKAWQWADSVPSSFRKLPEIKTPKERMMINGNEAIALGAISAGLKFYSFYPMTPSTSIGLLLAARADQARMIVEQAEDEISAINMAIGASFAGAPAMVGTSGGGFALMVEGVSLAAITETPVVIAVAQRPGPATGLPTRTEQADLEFVIHSGHGEFPRAVFAPGSVEECFHLTRRAFELAEKYQGPVFILTDQFLADSYRAADPFAVKPKTPVRAGRGQAPEALPYYRYRITESGVSLRLLPGATEHLVVADSDEHTEDGHLTEDLFVRNQMNQKRLRKLAGITQEVIPPEAEGDDNPQLLLLSWGSSKGAVKEAADIIRERGTRVSTLHFSQVWPLVPDQFMARLQNAQKVVCVEGNAFGQLARLIRRESGLEIKTRVSRYDGLPFTPEFIVSKIET